LPLALAATDAAANARMNGVSRNIAIVIEMDA